MVKAMQKSASDKHVGAHHLKDRLIIYISYMVPTDTLTGMMYRLLLMTMNLPPGIHHGERWYCSQC